MECINCQYSYRLYKLLPCAHGFCFKCISTMKICSICKAQIKGFEYGTNNYQREYNENNIVTINTKTNYTFVVFNSGDRFEGHTSRDNIHGYGKYWFKDEGIYKGYFENGNINGFGVMKYINKNIYSGNWKNNVFHGFGVMLYANGDKYLGGWKNNLFHGLGTYYYIDGRKPDKRIFSNGYYSKYLHFNLEGHCLC